MEDTVTLTPIVGFISEIAFAVLAAVAAWAVAVLRGYTARKTAAAELDRAISLVHEAIGNGIAYAKAKAAMASAGATLKVDNATARQVLDYLIANVPVQMRIAGVSEPELTRMILAKLQIETDPTLSETVPLKRLGQ